MKLAEEQHWTKAHAACVHATADKIQEYWSVGFKWTPLHIHT
jgi:hypothetical protein